MEGPKKENTRVLLVFGLPQLDSALNQLHPFSLSKEPVISTKFWAMVSRTQYPCGLRHAYNLFYTYNFLYT